MMAQIGGVIPVLPVSLVAAVFMECDAKAMDLIEIERRSASFLRALKSAGAPVFQTPRSTLHQLIGGAVHTLVLRRLLVQQQGAYRAEPGEKPLLRYYANAIAHWLPDHVAEQ
jgi:glycerol-3-phosphate O-acyltransferase